MSTSILSDPNAMVSELLVGLAPISLANRRTVRFEGDSLHVSVSRFAPADREILSKIYLSIEEIVGLWRTGAHRLRNAVLRVQYLWPQAEALGRATRSQGFEDPSIRKVVHDLRGGGLTMLLNAGDLLALMPNQADKLLMKFGEAARDHGKMMRNLLIDIDPVRRAAEEASKPHSINHFVDKWQGMTMPGGFQVAVHCSFGGGISARCLETSAIDRVVYNYVNNAVRFATGSIDLWVFPVDAGLIRWVVQNPIAVDQAEFLGGVGDLGRLYAGGVTRGGNGIGLSNCAEIVADCFGLDSIAEAIEGGYLGASVRGSDYLAWFHWPVYAPG